MTSATLQAIRYQRGSLEILDQLLLPHQTKYIPINSLELGHDAIKTMKVRGAPAIAIVAALTLAVVLVQSSTSSSLSTAEQAKQFIEESLGYLKTSRPTAVNLFDAAHKLAAGVRAKAKADGATGQDVVQKYLELAERMLEEDVKDNMNIGRFGAEFILKVWKGSEDLRVITHCNTGSLATAGYGTALGIIRSLASQKHLTHAYCTETRPYNQGSRLTAYELVFEQIPSTLITDSMASALLAQHPDKIAAIVVGADRVAANGDTANKIGTYQLAITARYHNVPFIVAAPSTSVDLNIASGKEIHIEVRPEVEVTTLRGPVVDLDSIKKDSSDVEFKKTGEGDVVAETIAVAARGIGVWNPSFDVTPAELISAIVTEKGVVLKDDGVQQFGMKAFLSGESI
ncbi:Methylthioribose-1-phosphate isomerase [Gamsiella multidivaricata]|uniref:Methylthioribose-1-phosphate isomerase n=1 Tax=Gamsiella multidivaricata TaxID=101098 RepID=UPI00221F218F|nr:Methylthioribose-1-phosphate isomerase [Gamsiella multidivaricata]KAG0370840.1 S-methyl-5-thioribose-1-phosphate isomerase [Gamsiella multidivaricata]KAI7818684.1 Methylthioribose-1-phosphate isomerase [Gamsiella multidivaricata]